MNADNDKQPSEADAELQREIRKERKFTLAEAIGRMAGPGAMKGASPIPRMQQAVIEIENWLTQHMPGGAAELQVVLLRGIQDSDLLLNNFEKPLMVLAAYCHQVLDSEYQLKDLVREADIEWGRVNAERPFFEQAGSPPNPDDPYTFESVRKTLAGLIDQLTESEEQ
jgi:hypothetical protein